LKNEKGLYGKDEAREVFLLEPSERTYQFCKFILSHYVFENRVIEFYT